MMTIRCLLKTALLIVLVLVAGCPPERHPATNVTKLDDASNGGLDVFAHKIASFSEDCVFLKIGDKRSIGDYLIELIAA